MNKFLIDKEILDVYDKYDHDFGLLDEPWALEEDRKNVTREQTIIFSKYVENLGMGKSEVLSEQMKENARKIISEIEIVVNPEVIKILRERYS